MPINIKKLRVGNIAVFNGTMILVDCIDGDGINGDECTADLIDQAKLVVEMLPQFGFQKLVQPSVIIGQSKTQFTHPSGMTLLPQTDGTFRMPGYDRCPITNIAQVQNILLDLFNFDLIIQL